MEETLLYIESMEVAEAPSEYSNPKYKGNPIVELSFTFSLSIIEFCDTLDNEKKYSVSKQLLRSGTSVGANVREAQNAESKIDFVHKMKIAAKELDETEYWLLLCMESKSYPKPEECLRKIETLRKILTKIISTSKSNREQIIR